jgi:(p)ppGpp synthase/HD superfamily hydrolase
VRDDARTEAGTERALDAPRAGEELLSDLVERAIRLAARAHAGQTRKGDGEPFITHPVAVALLCARAGLDAETTAAALLHDVLEDTDVTFEKLAREVGEEVALSVSFVTKEEGGSWSEKSRRYVERLKSADRRALAVAAADKIHNLYAMRLAFEREGSKVERRFNSTFQERVESYAAVRDLLIELWPDCPLLPELERQLALARASLSGLA